MTRRADLSKNPPTTVAASSSPQKAPRVRQTQEERTEAMRARLIAAAIDSLYRLGFAKTTTAVVAANAGVSRGAMLHHFPAKDDLLMAVVAHVRETSLAASLRALEEIADPVERFLAVPSLGWDNFQTPTNIASLEIWMATRSNPELRPLFLREQAVAASQVDEVLLGLARAAGVKRDRARMMSVFRLHRAAINGALIDAVIRGDTSRVPPVIAELRAVLASLLPPPRTVPDRKKK